MYDGRTGKGSKRTKRSATKFQLLKVTVLAIIAPGNFLNISSFRICVHPGSGEKIPHQTGFYRPTLKGFTDYGQNWRHSSPTPRNIHTLETLFLGCMSLAASMLMIFWPGKSLPALIKKCLSEHCILGQVCSPALLSSGLFWRPLWIMAPNKCVETSLIIL